MATLAPDGKSVQYLVCTDGQTGGLIMMRHATWTDHQEEEEGEFTTMEFVQIIEKVTRRLSVMFSSDLKSSRDPPKRLRGDVY